MTCLLMVYVCKLVEWSEGLDNLAVAILVCALTVRSSQPSLHRVRPTNS